MKKEILRKVLAMSIISILIGIGVYPAVAKESISQESNYKNEELGARAFLFQTIIDTLNNPSIKELLEQSKDDYKDVFINDIEGNNLIKKIIFKNPSLFFKMLFTKPSITHKYLNKLYNNTIDQLQFYTSLEKKLALTINNEIRIALHVLQEIVKIAERYKLEELYKKANEEFQNIYLKYSTIMG